jgi:hypothetical protein
VDDNFDGARIYVMLVSRVDMRYHVSWYRDVVAAELDPRSGLLPAAVCGERDCEPFDLRRTSMVVA